MPEMYKTLVFALQPSVQSKAALQSVVDLARRWGAHLIGVGSRAPIYLVDPWIISGDILQRIADDDEAQLAAAAARFHEIAAPLGPRAEWVRRQDFPNTALTELAAGADLIVACPEKGPEAVAVKLPDLVLEAGLPVLVIPPGTGEIRTRHILIGWRNTPDARRALTAALPLLAAADTVTLVQVTGEAGVDEAEAGLDRARTRLARHGVHAETAVILRGEDLDSGAILAEVAARGADLLVLGGYGHARAREWILGGVTQDLLAASPVPLLMVH